MKISQQTMYDAIKKTFWQGLKATLPILITIVLIVWFFQAIEAFFGYIIKIFIPTEYYFTGLGAIIGFSAIFAIGVLMYASIIEKMYSYGEAILKKIPIIKTLYTALIDLLQFFDTGQQKKEGHVVIVHTALGKMIGIVTRETFEDLPQLGNEEEVLVYLPMSYQVGGYTIVIKRSLIEPLDFPVEKAMTFILTGGMTKKQD